VEQRANIEFYFNLEKPSTETLKIITAVSGNDTLYLVCLSLNGSDRYAKSFRTIQKGATRNQYVETGTKVNELVAIDHPMIFKLLDVLSDSRLSAKQDEMHEICSSQSQRWAKAQTVTTCEDFKQTCQTN
jgi:hypothetical protein